MKITVRYSCHGCGLEKVSAKVPARVDGQDVVRWLEDICAAGVSADHAKRSPGCRSVTCDLMIPMTGTDRVGGPKVN